MIVTLSGDPPRDPTREESTARYRELMACLGRSGPDPAREGAE